MSLTFGDSTSHSSNWDGGQVPPRTLRLINHRRFNICPVPKGCPRPPTPPLPHHPLWRWVLGFIPLFSIVHSPQPTPPPQLTKHLFSHVQVKKRPSFPLFDKSRLKPRWGLPAKMPGTRQGCPSLPPYTFLPPSGSSFACFCFLFYF